MLKSVEKFLKTLRFARKRSQRIYIIPTYRGLWFLLSTIAILGVGAIFNNNAVNLLGYVLLSFFLLSAIMTQRSLKGVRFISVKVDPFYAGLPLEVQVRLRNELREERVIALQLEKQEAEIKLSTLEEGVFRFYLIKNQRGAFQLPQLRIFTKAPFGLFYTWSIYRATVEYIVFPKPVGDLLPPLSLADGQKSQVQKSGDFSHHSHWYLGQPEGHVDWKVLARGRGKFIKTYQDSEQSLIEVDWRQYQHLEQEIWLSQLAKWCQQALSQKKLMKITLQTGDRKYLQKKSEYFDFLESLSRMPKVEKI